MCVGGEGGDDGAVYLYSYLIQFSLFNAVLLI